MKRYAECYSNGHAYPVFRNNCDTEQYCVCNWVRSSFSPDYLH